MIARLELDDPRWMEFVASSANALPFHHPAWSRTLEEVYGFHPFALALAGDGDRIIAGLPLMEVKRPLGPRRWISLPFTDLCPPLARSSADLATLLADVARAATSASVDQVEVHASLEAPGASSWTSGVVHTLPLSPDPRTVLSRFSRSRVQRNIARAEREQLTVRRGDASSDLSEIFYELHIRTRRKQGVPVQPRRFFEVLWRRMLEPGLGFVLIAYAGRTPVAAAVFLTWNETVTYKYGASDPRFLKLRPNHIVFWEAIRWSCASGYRTFDFGKSDLSNHGLRHFKSGWGTREEPLMYSAIGRKRHRAASNGVPPPLRSLIRHSPLWVCRAVGSALYRYAA